MFAVSHEVLDDGSVWGAGPFASLPRQIVVKGGFVEPLNRFGDGEQHDAVVDGVQAVAVRGDDEVIAGATVPAGVGSGQPNASVQYLDRGLAGTLVIVQAGARGQSNQGLSQRVLVTAVDGVRAAAAVGVVGGRQVLAGERGQ
jgi:hypothetical protein